MKVFPFLLLLISSAFSGFSQAWPESLMLVPERSNFQKTSTYADVVRFLDTISSMSDEVRVISMGNSPEGKPIPVAVLARPAINSADEARKSGKGVVYIQGNIHAGEVEGKESVMMLMRDILLGDKSYLLDNQIILFAPIYNTDSNDKMSKGTRPSQEDSPLEAGLRRNSQDLDLNRDGVKLEANETRALISNIIVPWDPQLFVDLHTTNGTWHAWSLTWAPSYHSAGQPDTYAYTNDVMLPAITRRMKDQYDLSLGPYGDYSLREGWPVRNFYTYNHHPRYLVNQFGLRNRMAILSEAFAHERFYQRINSTYHFALEILEYTHKNIEEIRRINRKAENDAVTAVVEGAGRISKGVRFKMVPDRVLTDFPSYEYISFAKEDGTAGLVRTGRIVQLDSVVYHARFEPTVTSLLPRGYIVPRALTGVVDLLKAHGVRMKEIGSDSTLYGEVFRVSSYTKDERVFEGHNMARLDGAFEKKRLRVSKGDYLVDLAQPLANFIFYLLEPQSDDGVVAWNFVDDWFDDKRGSRTPDYPIFRYFKTK